MQNLGYITAICMDIIHYSKFIIGSLYNNNFFDTLKYKVFIVQYSIT